MKRSVSISLLSLLFLSMNVCLAQPVEPDSSWVRLIVDEYSFQIQVYHPQHKAEGPPLVLIPDGGEMTPAAEELAQKFTTDGHLVIISGLQREYPTYAIQTASEPSASWRQAENRLPSISVVEQLDAVHQYISDELDLNTKFVLMGIGSSGPEAFRVAMHRKYLAAVVVVGASAPRSPGLLARITAPVYAFLGGEDPACSQLDDTQRYMKASRKVFRPVVFPGVQAQFLSADPAKRSPLDQRAAIATLTGIQAILEAEVFQ